MVNKNENWYHARIHDFSLAKHFILYDTKTQKDRKKHTTKRGSRVKISKMPDNIENGKD